MLKHVFAIFNQSLYHRSLRKNRCILRLLRLHIQLVVLNIDFEQNLSSLRLSFDALIDCSVLYSIVLWSMMLFKCLFKPVSNLRSAGVPILFFRAGKERVPSHRENKGTPDRRLAHEELVYFICSRTRSLRLCDANRGNSCN